jgi:hypothetical protein
MTGPPRWDAVYRSAHVSDRALSKRDRVIDGQVELIRLGGVDRSSGQRTLW